MTALPKALQGSDAVLKQATGRGMRTCFPQLSKLLQYMNTNVEMGTQTFFAGDSPDYDLVSLSTELTNKTSLSFASADIAPVISASCAFTYDTVTYWPVDCDQVAQQFFGKMQSEGVLQSTIRILSDFKTPLMRVYLMPAGSGCVAIKKEVWF